jgi:hypothetical protein
MAHTRAERGVIGRDFRSMTVVGSSQSAVTDGYDAVGCSAIATMWRRTHPLLRLLPPPLVAGALVQAESHV